LGKIKFENKIILIHLVFCRKNFRMFRKSKNSFQDA